MEKLVVVTGGTKGIGRAIVHVFAAHGFDVATCSRNENDLNTLKAEIDGKYGVRLFGFVANLSSAEETQVFVNAVLALNRNVDVLVNNAGFFLPGTITGEPDGNLESMLNANLLSAYRVTRGLVKGMEERKSGHIFNMCSIASFTAYANGGSYAISKFAMLGFSKCLRQELKKSGIRVTAVMPGATFTDSWSGTSFQESRFMPPEDIADMVFATYALSPRSVVEDIVIRPQLGDL